MAPNVRSSGLFGQTTSPPRKADDDVSVILPVGAAEEHRDRTRRRCPGTSADLDPPHRVADDGIAHFHNLAAPPLGAIERDDRGRGSLRNIVRETGLQPL